MTDLAAQLCDGLVPRAPYRQIVFTLPVPLRLAMIRDSTVLSAVLKRTIRALFAQLRRRAKAQGVAQPLVAALSMIQRFGGALNPNVHFHVLVADGVFTLAQDESLCFVELPAPSDEQVYQLVLAVSRRVDRWMARWLAQTQPVDPDDDEQKWLERALTEAQPSPRPRWLRDLDPPLVPAQPRCAEFCGYAVHAQTSVPANDRAALERLLKYGLRAPLCIDRLRLLDQGRIVR